MFNCCSHGTLLHFSPQGSHLSNCYYHQDLRPWRLQPASRPHLLRSPRRPSYSLGHPHRLFVCFAPTARYRPDAPAPSIFRAGWFGRWVVTHSLAGSDFHGHRPAVSIDQHLLWCLMSVRIGRLNRAFGSSHSASSAYQKWPTGHSHSLRERWSPPPIKRDEHLTHLKFENRSRSFRPQCL